MHEQAKRVSWVELYLDLDLVFVLAVGQLAHVIVEHPAMHSVWVALGLFVVLWWTWVGFAVLYNRYGDDAPAQRVLTAWAVMCAALTTRRGDDYPSAPRAAAGGDVDLG